MENLHADEDMDDWSSDSPVNPDFHLGAQSYHSHSDDDAFEVENLFATPPDAHCSPTKSFRLQASNLFLTFPQCQELPATVLERIKNGLVPEWAVVCQEQHEDGSLHLHCCIHLKARFRTRHADCFDYLAGKHGDYRAARNLTDVLKYVLYC